MSRERAPPEPEEPLAEGPAAPEPAAADPARILEGQTVLVVAHQYGIFTKAQVDELASMAESVHVYVRYNRLGDLGRFVDIGALEGYGKADKITDESPENVYVHPTPVTYLPVDPWYRRLGAHHYWSASRRVATTDATFDIVHAHFTWSAGYVGARLSEQLGVPSVLTVHENQDWLERELSWNNDDLEWALRSHDAIIRVNEKDCDSLRAYNDSVYAIPNGFDPDRFPQQPTDEARRALDLPADAEVVFSVGHLSERKGFDRLIEAVARLERDDVLLGIGGRGDQRDNLEALAEEHADRVDARILGYLSDADLARWMNACDVFSLASEAEGNPTVMFEALGCGKPYVGTSVGGVDEIITDEAYGLYCPPNDVDSLASILERGLDRQWDREAIRQYAQRFTWERIVQNVARVYGAVWADDPTSARAGKQ